MTQSIDPVASNFSSPTEAPSPLEEELIKFREQCHGRLVHGYPVNGFIENVWGHPELPPPSVRFKLSFNPHKRKTRTAQEGPQDCFEDCLQSAITQMAAARQRYTSQSYVASTDVGLVTFERKRWNFLGFFGITKDLEDLDPMYVKMCAGGIFPQSLYKKEDEQKRKPIGPPITNKRKLSTDVDVSNKKPKLISGPTTPSFPKPAKRQPTTRPLQRDELAAIRELSRLLQYNFRSFVSGYAVNGQHVTLWYADRFGVIKSEPFDFIARPEKLLLLAHALSSGSLDKCHRFGISKHLSPDPESTNLDRAQLRISHQLDLESGRCRLYPCSFDIRLDHPDVKELWPGLNCGSGFVGVKGTTVAPIKAGSEYAKMFYGDGNLVFKMSYVSKTSSSESTNVLRIRQKLASGDGTEKWLKHVVELKYWSEKPVREVLRDFPRTRMDLFFEERVCTVIIMEEYIPLFHVKSAEHFERIFIQCIRAHHFIFMICRILHCDLSFANIMFRYNENGEPEAVLCDFDLSLFRPLPLPRTYAPNELTLYDDEGSRGTAPFMAIDCQLHLFQEETTLQYHHLSHDLESFFWLLLYFCVAFKPQKHEIDIIDELEWHPDEVVVELKRTLIHDDDAYGKFVADHCKNKEYLRFLLGDKCWVSRLRKRFSSVYPNKPRRGMVTRGGDEKQTADFVRYEEFMELLEVSDKDYV
ncbi:hypothetical protein C8Q75DRAFT_805962 [Abortiporus biennis]|nr:hypothetical protein C8Q75DRAFT_805962 [Abortiporus biennis]